MRVCSKCKIEKEIINFVKNKKSKCGFRTSCKSCANIVRKKWYVDNPEKSKQSLKKYYENNKEKISERKKIYVKSLSTDKQEKLKEKYKKWYAERKQEINIKKRLLWKNRNNDEKQKNYLYYREYYLKNKDQIKKKTDEYYKKLSNDQKLKRVEIIKKFRHSNPEKAKAWSCVGNAILRGSLIKPKFCSSCNISGKKIHGHYEDYAKPLEVVWLCHDCHKKLHLKKYKEKKNVTIKNSFLEKSRYSSC